MRNVSGLYAMKKLPATFNDKKPFLTSGPGLFLKFEQKLDLRILS
jgi:hypothetical protein